VRICPQTATATRAVIAHPGAHLIFASILGRTVFTAEAQRRAGTVRRVAFTGAQGALS